MSTSKKILSSLELKPYLSTTTASVKWLDKAGSILGRITAEQALAIVSAGAYSGKVIASRVVYIRELDIQRDFSAYFHDRPVLQPYSIGHPCLGKMVDQLASWDKWANAKRIAA